MSDAEYGKCEICKISNYLTRTYFRFPIKCQCCGPTHFELITHCSECIPEMPPTTTVVLSTSQLLVPIHGGLFKKVKE